ncbi:MAG: type II secretion system protein [Sulfurimonas sp.]|nr:type II secretion system protein [Sulfurimonas sp.]MDD3060575.1 type II secretion system protein [Sulfurimonas sp.]
MLRLKHAFTLIELIFAIVIIGIAVVSLPTISQVISKGSENSLVQEAVFIAFTEITKVTSSAWDENSRIDNDDYEHIIYCNDTEAATSLLNDFRGRSGNVRILYNTNNSMTIRPTALGYETGETREDDVDDYIATAADATGSSGSETGYKFQYKKDIAVDATSTFGTLANNPNIKKIQININDASNNLLVSFYVYATNSGSVASHPLRTLE